MTTSHILPETPPYQDIIPNKAGFCKKYMDIIMQQCKPNSTTHCLEWQGARNGVYSHMSFSYRLDPYSTKKKFTTAHRLLFAISTDSLYLLDKSYANITVSHLCHNPICCNLEHLEAEPVDMNNNRKICKSSDVCVIHEPPCILR